MVWSSMYTGGVILTPQFLLCIFNIGFPGQIREFTIQIHLLCIQNRQTWSGYENYHSTLFFFHLI